MPHRMGYDRDDWDQDDFDFDRATERGFEGRYDYEYPRDRGAGSQRDARWRGYGEREPSRGYPRRYREFGRGYEYDYNRDPGRYDDWERSTPWDRGAAAGQPAPWEVPGPYTGRGPRGYQRAADRICEDICRRLGSHGHIDARDIDVTVEDGVVTLRGEVDSREERRLAEDAADSVLGVRDVHNELRVRPRRQGWGGLGAGLARGQIREGMRVVGSDGVEVGTVQAVRSNDFRLSRSLARDLFVPFEACRAIQGDKVTLMLEAGQVEAQGWEQPEAVAAG